MKILDQGHLRETFDDVVYALRLALHYVASLDFSTDERNPVSDDGLGE